MSLYLGCPIWSFKGWVGNFYPEGTKPSEFLYEYARRLTTIEGNTTFYAVPAQKTIEQWAAATPETFRFCPKVPKAISHEGKLTDSINRAHQFIETMQGLGTRLGPMFLQLPPRYSPSLLDDLKAFLTDWPRDVRLAVEVRHLEWFEAPHTTALDQLLTHHNTARVTIDTRPIRDLAGDKRLADSTYGSLLQAREQKPDVPVIPTSTADFTFIRYIGHPDLIMNDQYLDEWADYCATQLRKEVDVYVFCHSPENLIEPLLCRELNNRIARHVPIASLPWDNVGSDPPEQLTLF
jgi:uncharacterized protein YecE (DUF72 family)